MDIGSPADCRAQTSEKCYKSAVQFSHLVQVNDPLDPLIEPLSREQLWRGLVLRAEEPLLFVLALDEFRIIERGPATLLRELRFGKLWLRDRVHFEAMRQVRYEVDATGESPAATLAMNIEEPAAGGLFVRFEYETLGGDADAEADQMYADYVKSAYVESDIDTIATIRRLAGENRLDGPH